MAEANLYGLSFAEENDEAEGQGKDEDEKNETNHDDILVDDHHRLDIDTSDDKELIKDIADIRKNSVDKNPASNGLNSGCTSTQSNRSLSLDKVPGLNSLLNLLNFTKK